jgi:hypothetical protein
LLAVFKTVRENDTEQSGLVSNAFNANITGVRSCDRTPAQCVLLETQTGRIERDCMRTNKPVCDSEIANRTKRQQKSNDTFKNKKRTNDNHSFKSAELTSDNKHCAQGIMSAKSPVCDLENAHRSRNSAQSKIIPPWEFVRRNQHVMQRNALNEARASGLRCAI